MHKDIVKEKIKTLFSQKKFDELIDLADKNFPEESRSSGLLNLIGVAKFNKKDLTFKDIQESLLCFEKAFLIGGNSIHKYNGLLNLIQLGIKASILSNKFTKFLHQAAIYYHEVENDFDADNKFFEIGFNLFSFLLDHKKLKQLIKKILNNNIYSKYLNGAAIFGNNYYYDWEQLDYLNFSKKVSKSFSNLKVQNLKSINYKNNEKINLGFVSCDFEKYHSITFFIKDIFKFIDKEKFKIFSFSLSKRNENDECQNTLKSLSDEWFDAYDLNNQELADLIQKERINILIDLMGYTKIERLELFNSRIAPKQVTWLGYCNTSGMQSMDYLLTDNNLILENEEKHYSEKIIKIPNIWSAHCGFDSVRQFNELPSIKNDTFNFGSFNNFKKISDEVVEVWSKILQMTSNSKLILKSSTQCDGDSLLIKFKKYQVENKVEILNKIDFLKKEDHLNLYKKIDLSLDTFPYNGVTTTFEALWMNIPVLVMKGFNFNSRCGESIIKNLKLEFLISENENDYISKAIMLYKEKENLKKIRKNIFKNLLSSPLFNTKNFAKNLTDILTKIHNS